MTEPTWNSPYPYGQSQPGDPRFGVPPGSGYTIPYAQQPGVDPLVSPNYAGWWSRGVAIVKRGWKPLIGLQAAGLLLTLLFQVPVGAFVALRRSDFEKIGTAQPGESVNMTPLLSFVGRWRLSTLERR